MEISRLPTQSRLTLDANDFNLKLGRLLHVQRSSFQLFNPSMLVIVFVGRQGVQQTVDSLRYNLTPA